MPVILVGVLLAANLATAAAPRVALSRTPGGVAVAIDGHLVTVYRYLRPDGKPLVRPYAYPVLALDGTPLTSDQAVSGGDHPHHRSVWTGQGAVNGLDHWSNSAVGDRVPRQRPTGDPIIAQDGLVQELAWDMPAGTTLHEIRMIRFLPLGSTGWALDQVSEFEATGGPVTLGDTKEAGLLAARVAPEISATPLLVNADGGRGETACWGKPATWCAIGGMIHGRAYTVAMLDHPENPRFPTRWHVRAYGLLAANPFGLADFDHAPAGTGNLLIPAGGTTTFHHRLLFLSGAPATSWIDAAYDTFSGEPGPALVPLLEGHDLAAHWTVPSPNPWWTLKDGVLTGIQDPASKGNVLRSIDSYGNVIVDVEYRYSGNIDSGIFLRPDDLWQCQIGISVSLHRDLTGSVYDAKRKYIYEAKAAPALNHVGEWNHLRIEARGDHFRHWLNGRLILEYTDASYPGAAPIGLQVHGGVKNMKVEFRNLRVLALPVSSIP
jgi:hypothetical protein